MRSNLKAELAILVKELALLVPVLWLLFHFSHSASLIAVLGLAAAGVIIWLVEAPHGKARRNSYDEVYSSVKEDCWDSAPGHENHNARSHLFVFETEEGWWKYMGIDMQFRLGYYGAPQLLLEFELLPLGSFEIRGLSLHFQLFGWHLFVGE